MTRRHRWETLAFLILMTAFTTLLTVGLLADILLLMQLSLIPALAMWLTSLIWTKRMYRRAGVPRWGRYIP